MVNALHKGVGRVAVASIFLFGVLGCSVVEMSPESRKERVGHLLRTHGLRHFSLGESNGLLHLDLLERNVEDLRFIRRLPIQSLSAGFTGISNLTPLAELPLEYLDVHQNPVSDLSPLSRLPLRVLIAGTTKITSIDPLARLPLEYLDIGNTPVEDITALSGTPLAWFRAPCREGKSFVAQMKGWQLRTLYTCSVNQEELSILARMPLKQLYLGNSSLTNLSPLRALSLSTLHVASLSLRDIQALRGLSLEYLRLEAPNLEDISPLAELSLDRLDLFCGDFDMRHLAGLELRHISFDPRRVTDGMQALREMSSLKFISLGGRRATIPVAVFWKEYDAGEYAKEFPRASETPLRVYWRDSR